MRHKLLGRSGLRVSELCLGTLTFGERKDWGADADAAAAILAAFVAGRRDDFTIATKFTAASRRHPLAATPAATGE